MGLFIDVSTVAADLHSLIAMALLGPNKFDAAMELFVIKPINKRGSPFASLVW